VFTVENFVTVLTELFMYVLSFCSDEHIVVINTRCTLRFCSVVSSLWFAAYSLYLCLYLLGRLQFSCAGCGCVFLSVGRLLVEDSGLRKGGNGDFCGWWWSFSKASKILLEDMRVLSFCTT